MTMAADIRHGRQRTAGCQRKCDRRRQRGQSLVEFAFLIPLFIGMMVFLRDVNIAINMAIVNQKYARGTMHFLFFNHRWYPEHRFAQHTGRSLFMQRWWVGVEDQREDIDDQDNKPPKAPIVAVGRYSKGNGGLPPQDDLAGIEGLQARHLVRIRSLAFVCLPPLGNKLEEPYSGHMPEDAFQVPPKLGLCAF